MSSDKPLDDTYYIVQSYIEIIGNRSDPAFAERGRGKEWIKITKRETMMHLEWDKYMRL